MSRDDAVTGLDSLTPRRTMPYSVSIPHTLRIAMTERRYPPQAARGTEPSEVLPGADALDGAAVDGLPTVAAAETLELLLVEGEIGLEVTAEDLPSRGLVGALDLDLHVEAAGTEDGGVDEVLAVRGAHHDDVLQRLHAVDLRQQLRHDRVLDVGGDPAASRAEQRVHLVEEHDDREALVGLLLRALEDHPDLALGLADVLVEQLRALHVQEVRVRRGAARFRG